MKILALIDLTPGADLQKLRAGLADELRGSWELYTTGTLREVYATAVPTRVVFVLEAPGVDDARAQLARLPLVSAGLMQIELIELKPFANWSLLFEK